MRRALASLAIGAACAGCIRVLDEEASAIGEVVRDCVVPVPAGVAALGPPVSLEGPDGSRWIWEEVELAGGERVAAAHALVRRAEEVCAAGPALATDASGRPASLLALTAAEQDENATRTDGRRLGLVPTGGLVHDGAGYLYYEHVLRGPGFFDAELLGTGLCVLPPGATACERVAAGDTTILWPPDRPPLDRGGLVDGDRALVSGCRAVADFTSICTVSSAPLDRLADPAAYQVWSTFDGWVDDPRRAALIADELGAITVAPLDGRYVMTALDPFDARVHLRPAPAPTGPFGRRIAAFDVVPSSWLVGGGREHAGLRDAPRTLHVSYTSDDPAAPGLHLATFRAYGALGEPP